MIGTELIRELVETIILTGKIKGADPCSLLLIAAPESGKTSIVLDKHCKDVQAFADVTGRGLHMVLTQNKDLSHIVINDMVAVLSHKQTVNRYTLSVLNAITEEGIESIATPGGVQTFECGRKGVIASITTEMAKDARYWWNKIGFASRMLPFHYSYKPELIIKIKDGISDSRGITERKKDKDEFKTPNLAKEVAFEDKLQKRVRYIADMRSIVLKEQGMRRLKQYLIITQAHALYRSKSKPEVTEADIEFLQEIDLFVSYETPKTL